VSLPVFKTGAPSDPRWAGSIPVRLRAEALRRTRQARGHLTRPPLRGSIPVRLRDCQSSVNLTGLWPVKLTLDWQRPARPVAISSARRCPARGRVPFPSGAARGRVDSRPPTRSSDLHLYPSDGIGADCTWDLVTRFAGVWPRRFAKLKRPLKLSMFCEMEDPSQSIPTKSKGPRYPQSGSPITYFVILLALLFVGVGGFVLGRLTGPESEDRGERGARSETASTLTLSSLDPRDVCTKNASSLIEWSKHALELPLPARLADHAPSSPPVGEFESSIGAPVVIESIPTAPMNGEPVLEGFVRGFNRKPGEGQGGYSIWAWEFTSTREATRALWDSYRERICDFGEEPYIVQEAPILVNTTSTEGGNDSAWWLYRNRVVQIDYSVWGDTDQALEELVTLSERVWEFNQRL
jgi:hypothetical protein